MAERKRKIKFSDNELQVITDDRGSSKVQEQHRTVSERNRIWDGSFQSVGAVRVFKCTSTDSERRRHDMKKRMKEIRVKLLKYYRYYYYYYYY